MNGRSHRLSTRRIRNFETLSDRRLLAVAEGAVFQADTTIDLDGLAGEISGTFQWGDGTSSPANIVGGEVSGNVAINIDFSLDSSNFFADPVRRQSIQAAADSIADRLGDNLSLVQVDSPHLTWQPSIIHPSLGGSNPNNQVNFDLPVNPTVQAGVITIFVGARPFAGTTAGLGGSGGNGFDFAFTATSQAQADQFQAAIDADILEIQGRGQAGATGDEQTDVAVNFGSIAFNSDASRFGFGNAPIQPGQVDFFAVAQHEIAHVLGFGEQRTDVQTSWETLTQTGQFSGEGVRGIFEEAGGTGDVPLDDPAHLSESLPDNFGIRTLLTPTIDTGVRQSLSPLDFALLDDLGWEVADNQVVVTGSHQYGDDGSFAPILVLTGSIGGEQTVALDLVEIENVEPAVAPRGVAAALQGESFTATLAEFSDPGFGNAQANPASQETFVAQIDWGDGVIESAPDLAVSPGSAGVDASGTVSGSHVYQTPGTFTVTISVTDDDGGLSMTTTTIEVFSATAFQNTDAPLDVNNDGDVDLLDALRNVNELRRRSAAGDDGQLDPRQTAVQADGLFDVDGNGAIEPLDLLLIINELRRQQFEPEAIDQVMLDDLEDDDDDDRLGTA